MKNNKMKKIYIILLIILVPFIVISSLIGDVDGDGKVGASDYVAIRNHLLNRNILTGEKYKNADLNGDSKVTASDYVAVRKMIINGVTPTPVVTTTPTPVSVTSIQLDKSSITLYTNYTSNIVANVLPGNASDKTITWSSSNPSIASVNNGVIKGLSEGQTTITATSSNGITASCEIKVINYINHDIRNSALITYINDSSRNIASIYKKSNCNKNGFDCDKPNDYKSTISGDINLYSYDYNTMNKTLITTVTNDTINYYFIPNNYYYIESKTNPSVFEIVHIIGDTRMINIPNMRNVRDIGGLSGDGGKIKYGKIIRGANPDALETKVPFESLNIKRIVDIRKEDAIKEKQANMKVDFKSITSIHSVTGYVANSDNKKAVKSIMKAVVNGKTVYFHCQVGTDRTGTIAYLLEGILGVKKDQRFDDYELSYFYRETSHSGKTREHESIQKLYKDVHGNYDKIDKDQERFINWYIDGSSTKTEDIELINNFRSMMIEGTPTKYKISGGKLKVSS